MTRRDDDLRLLAFGDYVRHARQEAGLTQAELARAVDKSRPSISRLERGQARHPMLLLLADLAKALQVPTAELLAKAGIDVADEGAMWSAVYWTGKRW